MSDFDLLATFTILLIISSLAFALWCDWQEHTRPLTPKEALIKELTAQRRRRR